VQIGAKHSDYVVIEKGLTSGELVAMRDPTLPVKELGGTGRVHDWNVSRHIRDAAHCPVFLAGGLRPENVGEAVARVQPFGIDVCSGVRTNGHLDAEKLREFMRFVQNVV
jgi:phosphoribosylanthranilate isomerase